MGFFSGLLKKDEIVIGAPMQGKCVSIKEVSDPTFSEEILGKGVAIIPTDGTVYAPASGTVTTVFPTGHAIAITTDDGVDVLIHVGLDTVRLEGKYFDIKVVENQKVSTKDILVQVDLEKVKEAGYDIITPIIICNSDAFTSIQGIVDQEVVSGNEVMKIKK